MTPKVLFICKNRIETYDRSVGLMYSASFIANYLNSEKVNSKVVSVIDGNGIDKEVFAYKPTHVIIEALWVTPDKMRELMSIKRYKDITWVIRIHSKSSFLAHEGMALAWIKGYADLQKTFKNLIISANSKEMINDLKAIVKKTAYLPNIYQPMDYKLKPKLPVEEGYLNFACMGAIRPFKNHLKQAIAAISYADSVGLKLKFHVNSDRLEQNGNSVYKNLVSLFNGTDHQLIEHPWMLHEDFINFIVNMDLGLQVSLSETFNIVAADFVWNNVPIIGSREIEWLPIIYRANPNSIHDIKDKISLVFSTYSVGLHGVNKIALNWYNKIAEKVWNNFLKI